MYPTAREIWRLGKKAAPVCHWSKGSLEQGNSLREISVSALRSEADTSMNNYAYKDGALLLSHNLYSYVLDIVIYHYID